MNNETMRLIERLAVLTEVVDESYGDVLHQQLTLNPSVVNLEAAQHTLDKANMELVECRWYAHQVIEGLEAQRKLAYQVHQQELITGNSYSVKSAEEFYEDIVEAIEALRMALRDSRE